MSAAHVNAEHTLELRVRVAGRLDVDLFLGPGCTAIVGPSGAGKSTLLAALTGLIDVDEARITVAGRTLDDRTPDSRAAGVNLPPEARGIGLAFQEARLFPHLTVRRNLRFPVERGGRTGTPDVDACAAALGITALLDRPADQLSGGEARRVALARALAAATDLLLLDEPLGSLDEGTRERILPWLHGLIRNSRVPTLIVTHRMSEAALLADHVVVIEGGKVVEQGAPLDVLPHRATVSSLRDEEAENLLAGTAGDDGHSVHIGSAVLSVAAHDLRPGEPVTVRLAAGEVIVGLSRHDDLSACNALDGKIVAIHEVDDGRLAVVDVGVMLFVSLTADAVAGLGLEPGREVVLYIKTTALRIATAR